MAGVAFLALLLFVAPLVFLVTSYRLLPLQFIGAWLVALGIGIAHGAAVHRLARRGNR